MTRAIWFTFGALAVVSLVILGCGRARASGSASAQLIAGPGGYTCFAIMNGDQAIGGNCIKE